jgi:membrane protein
VFSLFFVLVPNRKVRIKHALIGAFLSTVLFEVAKSLFVAFVSNANYKVIYGALATVPIFLFWLYIVWTVVLFGASLAASLTTFTDYRRLDTDWPQRWEFQLVFRLAGHLWNAQRDGTALTPRQLLELEPDASELQLSRLMIHLRDEKIANTDEEGNWMLARDIEDLSLGDFYRQGDYYLPLGDLENLPVESERDQVFVDSLRHIRERGETEWDRSLRSLYLDSGKEREA